MKQNIHSWTTRASKGKVSRMRISIKTYAAFFLFSSMIFSLNFTAFGQKGYATVTKDSITFELKLCKIEEKDITCFFSVVSRGKDVDDFRFYRGSNIIVDGDGNQISSNNSEVSSNILVENVPISGKIFFNTSNRKTNKIARFDIRYYDNNQEKGVTLRNIPVSNRYFPSDSSSPVGSQDETSARTNLQTIEKSGATFEVPGNWKTAQELPNVIALAPPENIKRINGQTDITFGVVAGVTEIKANTAKSLLNSVLKQPVMDTKGLDDASKWLVKELSKQFPNYKQTETYRDTSLDGKPAMQTRIEGKSKTTGKAETVLITTAITSKGKLFYLIASYPSDTADTQVFEQILNSVRLP